MAIYARTDDGPSPTHAFEQRVDAKALSASTLARCWGSNRLGCKDRDYILVSPVALPWILLGLMERDMSS